MEFVFGITQGDGPTDSGGDMAEGRPRDRQQSRLSDEFRRRRVLVAHRRNVRRRFGQVHVSGEQHGRFRPDQRHLKGRRWVVAISRHFGSAPLHAKKNKKKNYSVKIHLIIDVEKYWKRHSVWNWKEWDIKWSGCDEILWEKSFISYHKWNLLWEISLSDWNSLKVQLRPEILENNSWRRLKHIPSCYKISKREKLPSQCVNVPQYPNRVQSGGRASGTRVRRAAAGGVGQGRPAAPAHVPGRRSPDAGRILVQERRLRRPLPRLRHHVRRRRPVHAQLRRGDFRRDAFVFISREDSALCNLITPRIHRYLLMTGKENVNANGLKWPNC